ncbi:hypothetical protein [uncultured Granulicatella sp.]|uniref:hypothetical protein n=1 Tax=uncultured Granulicatella sp. TaxID=316089 RepID=UPI0028CFE743|nr:hypothetical protein [uncultured Granulicatella sp.]
MKVKKRVTKGARLYLLLSLFIIFISFFMLKNVVSYTEPIEEMFINHPLTEKEIEKVQVVRIYDIEKVELPNEKQDFYIIEDELGYHMLKSGNAKLDEMAEEASKLSKARPFENKLFLLKIRVIPEIKRGRRGRKIVKISPEMQQDFAAVFQKSNLAKKKEREAKNDTMLAYTYQLAHLKTDLYFDEFDEIDLWFEIGKGIVVLIVGLGFLVASGKIIYHNYKNYKELFELFPEVQGHMNLLVENAEYVSKDFALLVYKGHIIIHADEFYVESLNKIRGIRKFKKSYRAIVEYYLRVKYKNSDEPYELSIGSFAGKRYVDDEKWLEENYNILVEL